jgi:hypothetical protein
MVQLATAMARAVRSVGNDNVLETIRWRRVDHLHNGRKEILNLVPGKDIVNVNPERIIIVTPKSLWHWKLHWKSEKVVIYHFP